LVAVKLGFSTPTVVDQWVVAPVTGLPSMRIVS
jgi:hypothetical protein